MEYDTAGNPVLKRLTCNCGLTAGCDYCNKGINNMILQRTEEPLERLDAIERAAIFDSFIS